MIIAIGVIVCWPLAVVAQKCDRKTSMSADADVYENLPRFVTGRGWQGNIIARLPAGTEVYICWEQNTQFGLTSKVWVQVAFTSNRDSVAYGWVLQEATRAALSLDESFLPHLSPVTSAWAAGPTAAGNEIPWSPDKPPPQPPQSPTTTSNTQPEALIGDLSVLYGPLFIVMVLGMLAKAVVDWLDEPSRSSLVLHVRSGMIAILVSPIVFLGFLNAGQFSVSTQAYVVLMLLAFQNGFFWQTVLKRSEPGKNAPDKPT